MKNLFSAFALVALLIAGATFTGCAEETEVEPIEDATLEPMPAPEPMPEPAPMPADSIHMGLTDSTGM